MPERLQQDGQMAGLGLHVPGQAQDTQTTTHSYMHTTTHTHNQMHVIAHTQSHTCHMWPGVSFLASEQMCWPMATMLSLVLSGYTVMR